MKSSTLFCIFISNIIVCIKRVSQNVLKIWIGNVKLNIIPAFHSKLDYMLILRASCILFLLLFVFWERNHLANKERVSVGTEIMTSLCKSIMNNEWNVGFWTWRAIFGAAYLLCMGGSYLETFMVTSGSLTRSTRLLLRSHVYQNNSV